MQRTSTLSAILTACAIGAALIGAHETAYGQGGQSTGGGFGGGGGSFGGAQAGGAGNVNRYDSRVREIDSAIDDYFDDPEIKNILTPGEYSEWKLDLKAGQVIIADARSDAFDPALEVLGADTKVLATNDDRFPGDQRPLLLWRCVKDGQYLLRARCFRDKSGGQFFLRLRAMRSLDLGGDTPAEIEVDIREEFLLRIPLKAGQIKQVLMQAPNREKYSPFSMAQTMAPNGLPDIGLTDSLSSIMRNSVMGAVDGDYYVFARAYGQQKAPARASIREIVAVELTSSNGSYEGTGKANTPSLWKITLKKGDMLEASAPQLSPHAIVVVAETPDISTYKLDETENNPFYPKPVKPDEEEKGDLLEVLPSRARDERFAVFAAREDVTVWIASNGASTKSADYQLSVRKATAGFSSAQEQEGRLKIGNTDYWEFDAKAGDVMTFNSTTAGFAGSFVVFDPNYAPIWGTEATPDQASFDWSLIVRQPGRYLVAVSAIGDGGGGQYTLSRIVFSAKVFSKAAAATGNFSSGRAEVWKFIVTPDDPMLLHWKSSAWGYTISICDENGNETSLPRTSVDSMNQYGVLKVTEPRTYVIVLISPGGKFDYSIALRDLPGYVKKPG